MKEKHLSDAKRFLLTLLATTFSIILTFGTSAILDKRHKEIAKKEMVMRAIRNRCVQMMNVNEKELEKFSQRRVETEDYSEEDELIRLQRVEKMIEFGTNTSNPKTTRKP